MAEQAGFDGGEALDCAMDIGGFVTSIFRILRSYARNYDIVVTYIDHESPTANTRVARMEFAFSTRQGEAVEASLALPIVWAALQEYDIDVQFTDADVGSSTTRVTVGI